MTKTNARPKKKPEKPKSVTVRDPDHRLLSCYVDKNVLHNAKIEAAKLNMPLSDFIRYIVDQALEKDDLKPPMRDL